MHAKNTFGPILQLDDKGIQPNSKWDYVILHSLIVQF